MSGTTPSWAKPQNASPTRPKPACTSSAMQSAPAARACSYAAAQVAGRHGEDAVAREDVVADQEGRLVPRARGAARMRRRPRRRPARRRRASRACRRRRSAPPTARAPPGRAPRGERGGRRGRAVVGVLGDHGAAVARDGAGDLDRDVVRLAARVDEHHDRELVGEQRREPVGVGRHLVDEVARVRRQPPRLRGERGRHARMGVAHLRHVVVRVEQPVAVDVGEPDAVARREADGLVVAQRERRPEPRSAAARGSRRGGSARRRHAARLRQRGRERRRIVLVEQRRAWRSSPRRRRGCSRRCPGAARRARRR